jgi:hypothetical protein
VSWYQQALRSKETLLSNAQGQNEKLVQDGHAARTNFQIAVNLHKQEWAEKEEGLNGEIQTLTSEIDTLSEEKAAFVGEKSRLVSRVGSLTPDKNALIKEKNVWLGE